MVKDSPLCTSAKKLEYFTIETVSNNLHAWNNSIADIKQYYNHQENKKTFSQNKKCINLQTMNDDNINTFR